MRSDTAFKLIAEMKSKFWFEYGYQPEKIEINKELLIELMRECKHFDEIEDNEETFMGMRIKQTDKPEVIISAYADELKWVISMPKYFTGVIKNIEEPTKYEPFDYKDVSYTPTKEKQG